MSKLLAHVVSEPQSFPLEQSIEVSTPLTNTSAYSYDEKKSPKRLVMDRFATKKS